MVKEGYVEGVCPPLCLPWSRPRLNHSINGMEVYNSEIKCIKMLTEKFIDILPNKCQDKLFKKFFSDIKTFSGGAK